MAYLRDDTGPTLKIGFVVNLQKPAAEETALTLVYTRMSPDPQTGKYPETNVLPEKVVIAPGQSSGITWISRRSIRHRPQTTMRTMSRTSS